MKNLTIIKTAKLEDLGMWSLCKNILEHFPEMEFYIKEKEGTGEMTVDVFLGLNFYLFRGESEIFAEEDLDTFEKYLKNIEDEKIPHLTIVP